ncbi:MAG: hypothetical protein LBF27_08905 [Sphingobacterium sp.]|jgi:hypothetical protein|nr:hypothetical protein [Sphingobacterium sp.]
MYIQLFKRHGHEKKDPIRFFISVYFQRNSRGIHRFERFKAEAMQGLDEGKNLYSNNSVLAPLTKHLLESMMDSELENHLKEEKASKKKAFLTN